MLVMAIGIFLALATITEITTPLPHASSCKVASCSQTYASGGIIAVSALGAVVFLVLGMILYTRGQNKNSKGDN